MVLGLQQVVLVQFSFLVTEVRNICYVSYQHIILDFMLALAKLSEPLQVGAYFFRDILQLSRRLSGTEITDTRVNDN